MCLDDMLALVGTVSLMVAHVAGESKYRINRNKTAADLEKITNVLFSNKRLSVPVFMFENSLNKRIDQDKRLKSLGHFRAK